MSSDFLLRRMGIRLFSISLHHVTKHICIHILLPPSSQHKFITVFDASFLIKKLFIAELVEHRDYNCPIFCFSVVHNCLTHCALITSQEDLPINQGWPHFGTISKVIRRLHDLLKVPWTFRPFILHRVCDGGHVSRDQWRHSEWPGPISLWLQSYRRMGPVPLLIAEAGKWLR